MIVGRTNILNKKSRYAKKFFVCAPILTQMVLKPPQCHEGSEYVLSFKIEQREVGEKVEHTNRQTDTHWEIII